MLLGLGKGSASGHGTLHGPAAKATPRELGSEGPAKSYGQVGPTEIHHRMGVGIWKRTYVKPEGTIRRASRGSRTHAIHHSPDSISAHTYDFVEVS